MKARYWISIVAIVLIVVIFAVWYQFPIVKPFSVEDYKIQIEDFYVSDRMKYTDDEGRMIFVRHEQIERGRKAINTAKDIWKNFYDGVGFYRPYRVYFDEVNQTWLVTSSVFFFLEDGPSLIITTDGVVLAMWKNRL